MNVYLISFLTLDQTHFKNIEFLHVYLKVLLYNITWILKHTDFEIIQRILNSDNYFEISTFKIWMWICLFETTLKTVVK